MWRWQFKVVGRCGAQSDGADQQRHRQVDHQEIQAGAWADDLFAAQRGAILYRRHVMANAAASRTPIAMPNDTATKAISVIACMLACMRTPATLMVCPTTGTAQIRVDAKATSPQRRRRAHRGQSVACSLLISSGPPTHTIHRALINRYLVDRRLTVPVRWGHDQRSRCGPRSART
jgi:hypothetical protein